MYALREIEHEIEHEAPQASPTPRWGWLYAIVIVMGGVLTVTETTIPDGLARRLLEAILTLAMFASMAVWVRVNRVGLTLWSEGATVKPPRLSVARPRVRRQERALGRWL